MSKFLKLSMRKKKKMKVSASKTIRTSKTPKKPVKRKFAWFRCITCLFVFSFCAYIYTLTYFKSSNIVLQQKEQECSYQIIETKNHISDLEREITNITSKQNLLTQMEGFVENLNNVYVLSED